MQKHDKEKLSLGCIVWTMLIPLVSCPSFCPEELVLTIFSPKIDLAAAEIAEDAPSRSRYQAAATASKQQSDARKKEEAHPSLVAAEDSLEFAKRYDKFVLDGGEVENLVSANTAVYSWTMMDKAWEILDEKLKMLANGEIESESPSPILDIAGESRAIPLSCCQTSTNANSKSNRRNRHGLSGLPSSSRQGSQTSSLRKTAIAT